MMEKKGFSPLPHQQGSWLFPAVQLRLGALTAFVFLGMLVVWSIDGCRVNSFIDKWRTKQDFLPAVDVISPADFVIIRQNQTLIHPQIQPPPNSTQEQKISVLVSPDRLNRSSGGVVPWVTAGLHPNFSSALLGQWLAPLGEPCRGSKTEEISIPEIDGRDLVELATGEVHEIRFTALDASGSPRCLGGDYFEVDLSGESWKSRPLVEDFGNGTYSLFLQVHPDFMGDYNLTITLLFRHFEGLKFSPPRFVVDRRLRSVPIRFSESKSTPPELKSCAPSDFTRDVWVGRWTRHAKNESCEIDRFGRFRCLELDFPCRAPWCGGSLGALDSNGWVYSAHCSFKIFDSDSAWDCLKNRWIFFWGDSNHVDTIRNILNFVLGRTDVRAVPRRFDMNFTNPRDPAQSVRITSIFNGHSNETMNYEGLDSLRDESFRNLLRNYFSGDTVPDTVIMNSGLHDGFRFRTVRAYVGGAQYAASFWKDVMDSVRARGLEPPRIIYRTTVATGGYARSLGYNPSKMEAYNGITIDKFRKAGLVDEVIDNFDLTFPWHYDNRCNDGPHYGRAPERKIWRDGEIGHHYFVDLMLVHVLLNALCPSR